MIFTHDPARLIAGDLIGEGYCTLSAMMPSITIMTWPLIAR